jgi:hypothetical protein
LYKKKDKRVLEMILFWLGPALLPIFFFFFRPRQQFGDDWETIYAFTIHSLTQDTLFKEEDRLHLHYGQKKLHG